MATVLTVIGVLTYASIGQLGNANIGLDPDRLLTIRIDVPPELRADEELSQTADGVLAALRASPATEEVALWSPHVPAQAVWYTSVRVGDRPDLQEDGDLPLVRIHGVGAGASTLLGLRFVDGGDFTEQDRTSGRRVVLVSESAATEWWGDTPAVGRQLRRWNHEEWSTVVGVIADAPFSGRQGQGSDFTRDVVFLHDQDPQREMVFLARLRTADQASARAAQAVVREAVPDMPVYAVRFMEDIITDQEQIGRSTASLGGVFALAALALVTVGLYGMLANAVMQRALEIGIRKALGASTGTILRQVTGPVWLIFLAGGGAGVLAAWVAVPRLLDTTLFEVDARSVPLYVAALTILLLVTAPAIIGPALRGLPPEHSERAETRRKLEPEETHVFTAQGGSGTDAGAAARIDAGGGRSGEFAERGDHDLTFLRGKVLQDVRPFGNQVFLNTGFQRAPRFCEVDDAAACVVRMGAACDVALTFEPVDEPAGAALLEIERGGEFVERHRTPGRKPFERVALPQRDAVAADGVAVPELVHTNQLSQDPLERRRVRSNGVVRVGGQIGAGRYGGGDHGAVHL